MESVFFLFLAQIPILGIFYFFILWPSMFRAQLIDDAVTIAFQDKRIVEAIGPQSGT